MVVTMTHHGIHARGGQESLPFCFVVVIAMSLTIVKSEFAQVLQQVLENQPLAFGSDVFRLLLNLLRNPSLDLNVHNMIAQFLHDQWRQGKCIHELVHDVFAFANISVPMILFASHWFWSCYLELEMPTTKSILAMFIGSPPEIRADKTLAIKVVEKLPFMLIVLNNPIRHDFDLALIAFSATQDIAEKILRTNRMHPAFVQSITEAMRRKLDTFASFHDAFFFAAASKSKCEKAVALRRVLCQDTATTVAIKKWIAEFAGVPMGLELKRLRRAHENLFNLRNLCRSVDQVSWAPARPRFNSDTSRLDLLEERLLRIVKMYPREFE